MTVSNRVTLILLILVATRAVAQDTATTSATDTLTIGAAAPDFTLSGNDDVTITLSHYQTGKAPTDSELAAQEKNVVLVFVRAHW